MTIVTLEIEDLWLTSLNDDTISLQMAYEERKESDGIVGSNVNYGGRSVSESTSERKRSTPLTLYLLDAVPDIAQFRKWWLTAEPLLMRDGLNWWRAGVVRSANLEDLVIIKCRPRVVKVDVTFNDIDWNFGV